MAIIPLLRTSLFALLLLPLLAQGAITFVNASTDRSASDTSRAPADPTGATTDDLFIGFAWIDSEDGAWTCPTSWTEIDNQVQASATGHSVVCYIKRSSSAPNLTFSYSGTAANIRATIYAFRGQDTTNAFDVTYSAGSHYVQATDDPTAACSAITTNTDNAVVALLQETEFSAAGTPGAPSGYTLDSTGDGLAPQENMAYKTVTSAGTEAPGVWTHTSFNSGEDPQCYTLAIKPASSGALLRRRR